LEKVRSDMLSFEGACARVARSGDTVGDAGDEREVVLSSPRSSAVAFVAGDVEGPMLGISSSRWFPGVIWFWIVAWAVP